MVQAATLRLSDIEENPLAIVKVGNTQVKFLVDTGATMSSVPPSVRLPVSNTTVVSVGVAGIPMKEPLSEPTKLEIEGRQISNETLIVSKTVPLPLLGRQAGSHHLLYGRRNVHGTSSE